METSGRSPCSPLPPCVLREVAKPLRDSVSLPVRRRHCEAGVCSSSARYPAPHEQVSPPHPFRKGSCVPRAPATRKTFVTHAVQRTALHVRKAGEAEPHEPPGTTASRVSQRPRMHHVPGPVTRENRRCEASQQGSAQTTATLGGSCVMAMWLGLTVPAMAQKSKS